LNGPKQAAVKRPGGDSPKAAVQVFLRRLETPRSTSIRLSTRRRYAGSTHPE
jgi:hypothetical protein